MVDNNVFYRRTPRSTAGSRGVNRYVACVGMVYRIRNVNAANTSRWRQSERAADNDWRGRCEL